MTKKVTTFDYSWFDLKKYDPVKDFDIHDWHYQLSQRLLIHDFYEENSEIQQKTGVEYSEEHKTFINELIELIKIDPILTYRESKTKSLTIRETNYFDLFFASLGNNSLKEVFNLSKNGVMDTGITPVISNYNEGIGLERALLTISRNATDEQLENDFKQWLRNHRKDSGYKVKAKRSKAKITKSKIFKSQFKIWEKYKLLAYLDLTLIAKAKGEHITQSDLGETLFPDLDFNDAERIRITVRPKAEILLDYRTLDALSFEARGARHKK